MGKSCAMLFSVFMLLLMVSHLAFATRTMKMSNNNVVDNTKKIIPSVKGVNDNKNIVFGGVGSAIGGGVGVVGPFGGIGGFSGVGGGVGGIGFPVGGAVGGVGGAGGGVGIIP
ncbi:unnamed protein product [Amaranthus hypochondriacus]